MLCAPLVNLWSTSTRNVAVHSPAPHPQVSLPVLRAAETILPRRRHLVVFHSHRIVTTTVLVIPMNLPAVLLRRHTSFNLMVDATYLIVQAVPERRRQPSKGTRKCVSPAEE